MFKTLSIRNFQAHRETCITFDKGVNVITGTSDSGKSSILRSLNWLFNNRPSGDAFKNWNAPLKEPVTVQLELDSGFCVELERQNDKNVYSIYDTDGHRSTFSAIRTDIPKEITETLNLAEYNYQSQHQSYFLLQNTPGEVAKKLNDLVGLSIIDTLFSNIASLIRQSSIKINSLTGDRDRTEKELLQYEKLDEIGKIITAIEKLSEEIAVYDSSLHLVEEKLSTLVLIQSEREKLLPLIKLETKVDVLLNIMKEINSEDSHIASLNDFRTSLIEIKEQMDNDKMWAELEPRYLSIMSKSEEIVSLDKQLTSLEGFNLSLKELGLSLDTEKTNLVLLIDGYVLLIKEYKTCPTCGTRINEQKLSEIERSFNA